MAEAGMGIINREEDNILGAWELIGVEDPWTGKWERVKVPREEADYRQRRGLPQRPSYWGESEAKEWRRHLREEKEAVAREAKKRRAWRAEETRMMYLRDRGDNFRVRETRYGEGMRMTRPPHY